MVHAIDRNAVIVRRAGVFQGRETGFRMLFYPFKVREGETRWADRQFSAPNGSTLDPAGLRERGTMMPTKL